MAPIESSIFKRNKLEKCRLLSLISEGINISITNIMLERSEVKTNYEADVMKIVRVRYEACVCRISITHVNISH